MSVVARLRPRSVVASAARLSSSGNDPSAVRMVLPWQERAFAYYDLLGEIWYAAQFYAKALSKLELAVSDVSDPTNPIKVEDQNIADVIDRIQDPGGGRANLLGAYGRLMFLTGEALLLSSIDSDGDEAWEMLSSDELRWDRQSRTYKRYRSPAAKPEELAEASEDEWDALPDGAIAWRLWQRHPRYSNLADAPMRGVLDVCEELLILTRAVRAQGRSRSAGAGILWVPDEMTFTSPSGDTPEEDSDADPFMSMLTGAMLTPIADEGSASAVVPIVVRAAGEQIQYAKHMPLVTGTELYKETGLRMEAIQRIAMGLDLPPEILLGKADANHWSAWQIDEDAWKAHLQPVAQKLVDDLTAAVLRPTLRANGVADPKRYAVTYDASAVIIHPDRGTDAKDDHDRLVISDAALRKATGFDDKDAPDDSELARRIGVKLGDAGMAVSGDPTATPEPADPPAAPPEPPADPGDPPVVQGSIANMQVMQGAAELMVERCRELAGARLRGHLQRDRATLGLVDGVHNRDLAHELHKLGKWNGFDPAVLVSGACECYASVLGRWGLSAPEYGELQQLVERHAASTLTDSDPPRLPPGIS